MANKITFPEWTEADAQHHGDFRDEMTHQRQLASQIVGGIFEDWLTARGISVPNAERDENGGEDPANCLAILYGSQYDELVSDVQEAIENYGK